MKGKARVLWLAESRPIYGKHGKWHSTHFICSGEDIIQLRRIKKSARAVCCLLLTSLLISSTGCTTTEKTAAQQAKEDEYVTVTVTGSNIPKRVKKSDIAAGKVAKDEQMQLMDKDEFAKSLRPGTPRGN